jgi:hypothetical protein
MNRPHLPRPFVILFFILVVGFFFIGTLRVFIPAHALSNTTVTPVTVTSTVTLALKAVSTTPAEPENESLGSTPVVTNTGQAGSKVEFTPTPIPTNPTPTPTPVPEPVYIADMTGIIALAILMVAVILVGMAWGGRRPRKKKEPTK